MNEECQINYYAIIPATVRYDNRLKPTEKLIYGEITALANKKGYLYTEVISFVLIWTMCMRY